MAVTTLKRVLAQMQKWGCTEQELRDYVLRQEKFYKETADAGIPLTRWIQLKLGCSWPAAEVIIRWANGNSGPSVPRKRKRSKSPVHRRNR